MSITEIFEKYKHLDGLLSNREYLPEGFIDHILFEL